MNTLKDIEGMVEKFTEHLSIDQLKTIIEARASDIIVYIGSAEPHPLSGNQILLSSDIDSVCLNGPIVQINLTTSTLDNVMHDEGFKTAFGDQKYEIYDLWAVLWFP